MLIKFCFDQTNSLITNFVLITLIIFNHSDQNCIFNQTYILIKKNVDQKHIDQQICINKYF